MMKQCPWYGQSQFRRARNHLIEKADAKKHLSRMKGPDLLGIAQRLRVFKIFPWIEYRNSPFAEITPASYWRRGQTVLKQDHKNPNRVKIKNLAKDRAMARDWIPF